MIDNESKESDLEVKNESTPSEPKWNGKKEKRVDYQTADVKVKERQETVIKKDTVQVYNPGNLIVEIDLGRDKSVRIAPFTSIELDREFLDYPGFKTVEGLIKIH